MSVPCSTRLTCPGTDFPVSNFSSEALDIFQFGSTGFPIWNPHDPLGPGGGGNPPAWFAQGCVGPCYSAISQQAADLCAAAQAFLCFHGGGGDDGGGPHQPIFLNNPQSCCLLCPDGTPFCFLVPGGLYPALNQGLADFIAQEAACNGVITKILCLGDFNPNACLHGQYHSSFDIAGSNPGPFNVTVTAGALPPGFALSQSNSPGRTVFLDGTPSSFGNFTFTLQATDNVGNFASKQYTITVVGINNTPPNPTLGQPYSFAFTVSGGQPPYFFQLVPGGALPSGLSLDTSGNITGTPTQTGTFNFQVSTTDANGATCVQPFTMGMNACVDWTKLVYTAPTLINGGDGSASGSASGVSINATAKNQHRQNFQSEVDGMVGTMVHNGGTCVCTLTFSCTINYTGLGIQIVQGGLSVSQSAGGGGEVARITVIQKNDGTNLGTYHDDSGVHPTPNGPFSLTLTFTVHAGPNTLTIQGSVSGISYAFANNQTSDGGQATVQISATLGN